MPELFGVWWAIYALLGALVILLVLLLVVSRRRRKAETPADTKAKKRGKPSKDGRTAKVDKKSRYAELRQQAAQAEGAAYSGAPPAAPAAPQAPMGYDLQQMAPTAPAAPAPLVHSVPVEQFMPDSDPLSGLVIEVLSGWGEITQEDTNRLAVFRPERIVAALTGIELPRDLRNSDQARARLSQLRRWAGGVQEAAARAAQTQTPTQQGYVGLNAGVAQQPTAGTRPAAEPNVATPPAPAAPPTPAAAVPPTAPAAPAEVPAPPQPAPEQKWEPDWDSPSQQPSAFGPRVAQPDTPVTGTPPAAPAHEVAPTIEAAPAPEAVPPAPAVAPAPQGAMAVPDDRQAAMLEATKSTEAAIAAAAAAFWARPENSGALPDPAEVPAAAPAPNAQATPASVGSRGPGYLMDDLRGGANTAEAVLQLPAAEQDGALAFLKPTELAKVLRTTADTELKKTAIEQLQSIGSPEALAIIQQNIGDPGPQP